MAIDLVIENESVLIPGDFVVRVRRCDACNGEGSNVAGFNYREPCQKCNSTGRLGMIDQWPAGYPNVAPPVPSAEGVTIPRELAERCEGAFLKVLAFTRDHEYRDGLTADAAAIRALLEGGQGE